MFLLDSVLQQAAIMPNRLFHAGDPFYGVRLISAFCTVNDLGHFPLHCKTGKAI